MNDLWVDNKTFYYCKVVVRQFKSQRRVTMPKPVHEKVEFKVNEVVEDL